MCLAEGVDKAPGSGLSALQGNVFSPAWLEGAFWGAPGVPGLLCCLQTQLGLLGEGKGVYVLMGNYFSSLWSSWGPP